jgi:hypothetical protein
LIRAADAAKLALVPAHIRAEKRYQHLLDTLNSLVKQGR